MKKAAQAAERRSIMNKLRFILILCAAMLCLTSLVACNGSSDGNTDVTTTEPQQTTTEGKNDVTEPENPDPVEVSFVFNVKDQDGNALAGVELQLLDGSEVVFDGTSDVSGVISGKVLSGKYTVSYEKIPEGYQPESYASSVDVTDNAVFELVFNDVTPDGSVEKPFVILSEENEIKIPAGATYNYVIYRPGNRIITIENTAVELVYLDKTYTADANGKLELQLMSEDSSRDSAVFTMANKTDAEISFVLVLASVLGSTDNPIAITSLDSEVTATVQPEGIVYYSWVAVKSGVIKVSSDTEYNNISLVNKTVSSVTSFTSGRKCEYLAVSAGDEIGINVSAIGQSTEARDVVFTLSEYSASAEDPIVVNEDSFAILLRSGAVYCFSLSAEGKTLTLSGKNYTVKVGDTDYTPDADGKVTVALTSETRVTVSNTSDKNTDISFEIK